MEESVYITCISCHGPGDLQHCLVPAPLLIKTGGIVGGYVKLNLSVTGTGPCLVCRAVPVMNSYSELGYQVLACNCVRTGMIDTETSVVTGNYSICASQLTSLKTVNLHMVTVSVIVQSVEDVLKYRKNKKCFEDSLKRLLKLYGIVSRSIVNCKTNSLAKVQGISQMTIGECSLSLEEVGIVTADTKVVLCGIESEDRRRMTVHTKVSLGGLDHILLYLQRLITHCWNNQEEFRKAGVVYPSGKNMSCGSGFMCKYLF